MKTIALIGGDPSPRDSVPLMASPTATNPPRVMRYCSNIPKSVNRKSAVAVMLVFMGFVHTLSRTRRFGDDCARSPWIR